VTREHKLALIVGFSLVLLVGVLIADHLSLARRAQIAPVGDKELSAARGPVNLMDPLRTIEHQLAMQTPAPTPWAEPPAAPVPVLEFSPRETEGPALVSEPAVSEPVHIAQGRHAPAAGDSDLIDTARSMGWEPRQQGGVTVLTQTVREQARSAEPGRTLGMNAPPPAPTRAAENHKTYTVQRGDSWFRIAQRHYGDGNLWKELARFNGGDEVVRLGAAVKIPSREALTGEAEAKAASQPAAPSARPEPRKQEPAPAKPGRLEVASLTYTVKRGDTLGEIAQRTLGTSRRWREIADLNNIKDVDVIPAGTVLKLPPMRG
jgi:nucleoid-associated protein YgaU